MAKTKSKITDEFAVTKIAVTKKASPKKEAVKEDRSHPELVSGSQKEMPKQVRHDNTEAKKEEVTLKPRGKKYQSKVEEVEKTRLYPLNQAVELVQKVAYTNFPSTVEIHINTISTGIRGLVNMPYVSGKSLRVVAFGTAAEESGADMVGSDEVLEEINKGKIDFDVLVADPSWMPKLAKVARILGPRGLMPNPKAGTVTDNLKKAVEDLKGGKTEYKTEPKGQVIHLAIGKVDQPVEEISANVKALYNTIGRSRIKKITLAPTMGPGVRVNISSI